MTEISLNEELKKDLKKILDEKFDLTLKNLEDKNWEEVTVKNQGDCKIERRFFDYSPIAVVKGEMIIENSKRTPFEIAKMLPKISIDADPQVCKDKKIKELFKKADQSSIYVHTLKLIDDDNFGENASIRHCLFDSGSRFVANRDLIYVSAARKINDKKAMYCGGSVPEKYTKDWPKEKKAVRADLIYLGWVIEEIGEDKIRITYQTQTDSKGSVPVFVYNLAVNKVALSCKNYCEVFEPFFKGKELY